LILSDNIWISGIKELIEHAVPLIDSGEESNLRIAMICIDNAIELMIKSYLALNKRMLGVEFEEYKKGIKSFPKMLNLLQKYSNDKISLDELDKIEYFHMIRNNLYHQGSGISVIKSFVSKYVILAQDLLSRLFQFELILITDDISRKQGEFLHLFRKIEVNLRNFALTQSLIPLISKPYTTNKIISVLLDSKKIPYEFANKLANVYHYRNEYVHGLKEINRDEFENILEDLKGLNDELINIMNK